MSHLPPSIGLGGAEKHYAGYIDAVHSSDTKVGIKVFE